MTSFPIADLVIGMIFIYFLLSVICSSVVELWFWILNTRARILQEWLVKIFDLKALKPDGTPLLNEKGEQVKVGQAIMDHCITTALSETNQSTTYIDAGNFVTALLDQITLQKADVQSPPVPPGPADVQLPPATLDSYITAIASSPAISGELKRTILSFAYQARAAAGVLATIPAAANVTATLATSVKSEIDEFRSRLEHWYDTTSERLTSSMKRKKAVPATVIAAALLTVLLNVDSIMIAQYLYHNPEQTKALADRAMTDYRKYEGQVGAVIDKLKNIDTTKISAQELAAQTKKLHDEVENFQHIVPQGLPLGWQSATGMAADPAGGSICSAVCRHWFGWLASILAISMGAPFWFDLLNKIASLRSTGAKPANNEPKTAS